MYAYGAMRGGNYWTRLSGGRVPDIIDSAHAKQQRLNAVSAEIRELQQLLFQKSQIVSNKEPVTFWYVVPSEVVEGPGPELCHDDAQDSSGPSTTTA